MQRAKAITKYVRISPYKARLMADLIRGKNAGDAMDQLSVQPSKGARLLYKTLKSAVHNAEEQHSLGKEELKVVEVRVDGGPHIKRVKPRNRGGRSPILKRTSHMTVVVGLE